MHRQQMLPAMAARLCLTPSAAIALDTVQSFQRQQFTRSGSSLLSCTEMSCISRELEKRTTLLSQFAWTPRSTECSHDQVASELISQALH